VRSSRVDGGCEHSPAARWRDRGDRELGDARLFSPLSTRILGVDKGSTDGSVEWLRREGVPTVALCTNGGHGSGLDLGWLRARTQTVVTLDVDAFPISDSWAVTAHDTTR
jgi:GT2 family glycosyltransferase